MVRGIDPRVILSRSAVERDCQVLAAPSSDFVLGFVRRDSEEPTAKVPSGKPTNGPERRDERLLRCVLSGLPLAEKAVAKVEDWGLIPQDKAIERVNVAVL